MNNATKYHGGCWPTQEQEWLLQASLLQGPRGLAAWERWKSSVNVEDVDYASHRLFPLLYHNLHSQGVRDPLMERLKSVYRKTWFENQLLFHRMTDVLNAFRQEGIATLVLKGAAMVPLYYRDYGLRPMQDFDILIGPADLPHAIELLGPLGWQNAKSALVPLDRIVQFDHALVFLDKREQQFDLHWHALRECCWPGADDAFWAGSAPTNIEGAPTRRLNYADELLHTAVHGVAWNVVSPFRWAADATMLLNASASEIDWSRLVTQARERRLTLPVRAALSYLQDTLEAPIPPHVLADLAALRVSPVERLEYRVQTGPDIETVGWLPRLMFWYLRLARGSNPWRKVKDFPAYLQSFLGLSRRQMPLRLLRSLSAATARTGRVAWLSLGQLAQRHIR
jgi:hypothetical protein